MCESPVNDQALLIRVAGELLAAPKPDDPHDFLPRESQAKIAQAWDECNLIVAQTRAAVGLRWEAESSDLTLKDYASTGQAFIDIGEARLKGFRIVLRAKAEEYRRSGFAGQKFQELMRWEVGAIAQELDVPPYQRVALEVEFLFPSAPRSNANTLNLKATKRTPARMKVGPRKSGRPAGITSEPGSRRIEAHCSSLNGGREKLAELAGISGKTVSRLIDGGVAERRTWMKLARAMRITYEELTGA